MKANTRASYSMVCLMARESLILKTIIYTRENIVLAREADMASLFGPLGPNMMATGMRIG
jgi:hypothetical protein